MKDISLHLLDIVQNSIRAEATCIEVGLHIHTADEMLTVVIRDNGKGMDDELLKRVESPFATTRTTRKVGLGIPLFKASAERSGGRFSIESELGVGTVVTAQFGLFNIDRPPLGELADTLHMLIVCNPEVDFVIDGSYDEAHFHLDTREVRQVLGPVPLNDPEVGQWLRENLSEGIQEIFGGVI